MHPLLWMNVVLDFICMGFTEESEASKKFKMKTHGLHQQSNQRPHAFQPGALDRSAMLTVDKLCFTLLHYLSIL